MAFNDLKVTITKVEGNCSRSVEGTVFFIRNAKLELPPGESICIFALGSILQPLSAAIIRSEQGESMLDILQEWQCPDPYANVIFKIEKEV